MHLYVLTVGNIKTISKCQQKKKKKSKQKILSFLFIFSAEMKTFIHVFVLPLQYFMEKYLWVYKSKKTISFTLQQQNNSATNYSLEHIFDRNWRLQSNEFHWITDLWFMDSTRRCAHIKTISFICCSAVFTYCANCSAVFFLSFLVDSLTRNSQKPIMRHSTVEWNWIETMRNG